ncbi:MAG TPA: holo-ACP synthase [Acidimicrobiales bacterium]|nr:holo-ACP synthase [Acidimicrobiales bacterium]
MGDGIVAIGTDVVDLDRFRLALKRTPGMVERVFTDAERAYALRKRDPTERLAARFAVKEATMKALGVGLGAFRFHDVEVVKARSGEPSLRLGGRAAELAERRGVTGWKVSITHSDLVAFVVVVATG